MFCYGRHDVVNAVTTDENRRLVYIVIQFDKYKILYSVKYCIIVETDLLFDIEFDRLSNTDRGLVIIVILDEFFSHVNTEYQTS